MAKGDICMAISERVATECDRKLLLRNSDLSRVSFLRD